MDKVLTYQYIASLIVREQLSMLSGTEADELAAWLAENEQHRLLYEQVKQNNFEQEIIRYQRIDPILGLKKYHKRYPVRKRNLFYPWSAAAILFLLLGTGIFLWQQRQPIQPRFAEIHPGGAHAELILNDGSVHSLKPNTSRESIAINEMVIQNVGCRIEYPSLKMNSSDTVSVFHELKIPIGGEYQLVMADGTKVWLNSQTRLRFPMNFKGKERRVYLEGEAYFEVSRDKEHPFIVCMKDQIQVKVLGTSFNVRAYADEDRIETVLEEGAIQLRKENQQMIIEPGMMAAYDDKSKILDAKKVDTELYTAWKKGHFVFQDESLENILHRLSRWYGMTVFYANEEVKELLFSGDIHKYDTIQNLLEVMEISGGVRFEVKGNTLMVYGAD